MTGQQLEWPDDQSEAKVDNGPRHVIRAEIAHCHLPLPHPIHLGSAIYTTREYVALRLVDAAGREGFAFGYARGLPLADLVRPVAQAVIGADAWHRKAVLHRLAAESPAARSTRMRGISLVEIALQDLAARQAGLPLSALLGGRREKVPVMAVAGYFRDVRGDDAVIEEIRALANQGFAQIKLMIGAIDSPETLHFLSHARESLPSRTRLVVDAHYAYATVSEAVRAAHLLAAAGVDLLEDPFLPSDWRKLRELSRLDIIPLAAGEDVSEPTQYLDLLASVATLRVDPTTCGGVAAALSGIEAAGLRGIGVLPHVFTGLSSQLAGGSDAVSMVEYIPPTTQSDPIDLFFTDPPRIENGSMSISTLPGAHTGLRWDELREHSAPLIRLGS